MSDTPREPDHDDESATSRSSAERSSYDRADEPVTGPPASSSAGPSADAPAGPSAGVASAAPEAGPDPAASPAASTPAGAGGQRPDRPKRRLWSLGPAARGTSGEAQRRRRRFFVAGIAVAAALIVIALCAGALSVVSAVDDVRDRAAGARESHRLRDAGCLELEKRLNRLTPPGATSGPAARATAIRDENAAVRIYLDGLDSQRDSDGWRRLLDSRTVFADALDRQSRSRTTAFYVAPRTAAGLTVADELVRWSPAPCAGPIRRLAEPEL